MARHTRLCRNHSQNPAESCKRTIAFFGRQANKTYTGVKSRHLYEFIRYIKIRHNQTFGGSLSASTINKIIQSVNTFVGYLNQTNRYTLDFLSKYMENDIDERIILTIEEIKELYEATYTTGRENAAAMGQRDRVIIAIFYGCGLRKGEGNQLNINDIDILKRLVFVRKAKGNKQRYVPIATKHIEDIREYIEEGRYWFLQNNFSTTTVKRGIKKTNTDDEAFFLNQKGKRMQDFCYRLRILKKRTSVEKQFSTHSLRHSIATHLLQSGMKIEDIARFLGHSSLESTQIYAHIVNEQTLIKAK